MTDDNKKGFGSSNYDPQTAEEARSKGGQVSSSEQDMSEVGRKGGQAAQGSGNAHELTDEERSQGGQNQGKENNPGNFANDTQKASEAGKIGGSK